LAGLKEASAWHRLSEITVTGFNESPLGFQVVSNLVFAGVAFGLAWGLFNLLSRDEQPATPGRGPVFQGGGRLRLLSAGRPWRSALIWKDFYFIGGGRSMILVKLAVYGGVVTGMVLLAYRFSLRPPSSREALEAIGNGFLLSMPLAVLIESALYASRIFREEDQWKTLSGLVMLPRSIAAIAYPKIAGCLLALTPAVGYFCLGYFLNPRGLTDFLNDALDEPGFWCMLISCFLFLHLVAFLSLVIKWGALPLAFGLVYLFPSFCITAIASAGGAGEPDGLFAVLSLLGLVAISILHVGIGERLRWVAAR
jgi:hypothetical protein